MFFFHAFLLFCISLVKQMDLDIERNGCQVHYRPVVGVKRKTIGEEWCSEELLCLILQPLLCQLFYLLEIVYQKKPPGNFSGLWIIFLLYLKGGG